MRRRSREAEILAGVVVAVLVGSALLVVYVSVQEVAAAVRSGLPERALRMGAAALLAVVVGVVSLASWSRWRNVTERPRAPRRGHVPSKLEVAVVGLLVAGLSVASWPVVVHIYRSAREAFSALELAAAVGYAVGGVAFVWFVVWVLLRYVQWERMWLHADDNDLLRPRRRV